MGKISDSTKIAGSYTVGDWKELRKTLLVLDEENTEAWKEAFAFFEERIETRFLKPIRRILSSRTLEGEGFSAAALQCILVEFLEAFYQGKIYRPTQSEDELEEYAIKLGILKVELKEHLQPNEYHSSAQLFRDFLIGHDPFRSEFSPPLANAFYRNIRCGLLHEAATKGGSKILDGSPNLIRPLGSGDLVLYRTSFQKAIDTFIENYKRELFDSQKRKKAFILKMDDICQMNRTYYFAYGSNMSSEQLNNRVGTIYDKDSGYIKDYAFSYNKKSNDGSSKANITSSNGDLTYGVCFEIDEDGFNKLMEIEKGYRVIEKPFYTNAGKMIITKIFISDSLTDVSPTHEYVDIVVKGAKENRLPNEYTKTVLVIPSRE